MAEVIRIYVQAVAAGERINEMVVGFGHAVVDVCTYFILLHKLRLLIIAE